MKNIKKIITSFILVITISLTAPLAVNAKEYIVVDDFELEEVQKNDNNIETETENIDNITEEEIKEIYPEYENLVDSLDSIEGDLYVYGRSFHSITKDEFDLLCRLVQAESGNQCLEGKVAVAEVVFNRMEKEVFPDTVHDVIYAPSQFQPTRNGAINKKATKETKACVLIAMQYQYLPKNVCYFKAGDFFSNLEKYEQIGDHYFSITNKT